MFAEERQQRITEIIQEYKHIDVNSLSSMLSVTKATVRRDLDILENDGVLKKVHGGAVFNEDFTKENYFSLSSFEFNQGDPLIKEKRQIGKIATKLITKGDVIYLGHGRTCAHIAENIKSDILLRGFTVVTNNVLVVNILYNITKLNVICIGGQTNPESLSAELTGPLSLKMLTDMNITKSFITVDGISIDNGYMLSNIQLSEILKITLNKSKSRYLVADYSKFDKNSLISLCDIYGIENIISNGNIPNQFKTFYYENNIKLFTTIEDPKLINS